MPNLNEPTFTRGRYTQIIEQLSDLAKRGYSLPWINEDGITPLNKLILAELINLKAVPGSIECLRELEEQHGIEHAKILSAANEVLPQGEFLQTFNFCKAAIKALENEIIQQAETDPERAEVLLARYAGCVLRERGCHVESINDLMTVLYNIDTMYCGCSSSRVTCLLNIIKAWKSGLMCGVMEECCRVQEKFAGKAQTACGDFHATINKLSVLYGEIQTIKSNLNGTPEDFTHDGLKEHAIRLQAACSSLAGIINRATSFNDKHDGDTGIAA
ncbi:MAG TPA: hypothetical protein VGK02_01775 [Candidatus Aquicultor sp.]|jgi:hypothetical protein